MMQIVILKKSLQNNHKNEITDKSKVIIEIIT
jgi:hypothetical protein